LPKLKHLLPQLLDGIAAAGMAQQPAYVNGLLLKRHAEIHRKPVCGGCGDSRAGFRDSGLEKSGAAGHLVETTPELLAERGSPFAGELDKRNLPNLPAGLGNR